MRAAGGARREWTALASLHVRAVENPLARVGAVAALGTAGGTLAGVPVVEEAVNAKGANADQPGGDREYEEGEEMEGHCISPCELCELGQTGGGLAASPGCFASGVSLMPE